MRRSLLTGLIMTVVFAGALPATATTWDAIADGGFELGPTNPVWTHSSQNYGDVIKNEPGPVHSGSWYASLGTADTLSEIGWIEQDFMAGTGEAFLKFWWTRPVEAQNEIDHFKVSIDGTVVFEDLPYPGIGPLTMYIQEIIDISPWADGGNHTLRFEAFSDGTTITSFGSLWLVDDVEVITGDAPLLTAAFSWTPENAVAGNQIQFLDGSEGGPDSWEWDFGDGQSAIDKDPIHTFDATGEYLVTLTVHRSSDQSSDSAQQMVMVGAGVEAQFSWDPLSPLAGESVIFFNESIGADSWLWDFGEGTVSTLRDPVHVFEAAGEYLVTLTASGTMKTSTDIVEHLIVVRTPLQADFLWIPADPIVGQAVLFEDTSIGDPTTWMWTFPDGSEVVGPTASFIFDAAGPHDVGLTVTRSFGSDTETDTVVRSVTVEDAGEEFAADFSWTPLEPKVGEAVDFIDLSTGDPATWSWDFGDGQFGDQQEPTHRFTGPGTYFVTLTIADTTTGLDQSSAMTKEIAVSGSPLEAEFFWIPFIPKAGEDVEFRDFSRGQPDSWRWEFGDGEISEEQFPVHSFSSAGEYAVSLTIGRSSDEAEDTASVLLRVADSVEIDFSWEPEAPQANHPVQFTEIIDAEIGARFWSFGDGSTSTEENPVHVFDQPGSFRVQLWAKDAGNEVLAAVDHIVEVSPPELEIGLEILPLRPEIGQEVQYRITGVDAVDGLEWRFGGLGCGGETGISICVPNVDDDCLSATFAYTSEGFKPVRLHLLKDGITYGPVSGAVQVQPIGVCSGSPIADFTWWPAEPMVGQRVRCVDLSAGPPEEWSWTFDDDTSSSEQHAIHVFDTAGAHPVELTVTNENGVDTIITSIEVQAVDQICGNGICEPGETTWSCRADCGPGEDETGRGGRQHTALVVPAAAGGVVGQNGTYWLTDATILNPGATDAKVVVEFVPDSNPTTVRIAGPATIPPRTAIHFDNVVEELFHTNELGSLWIDSNFPIIANTRTFNRTEDGTFGQGIGGITRDDVLGSEDGKVYLLGLRQNDAFRTNLLIQEISGSPVTAEIRVFDKAGTEVGSGWIPIGARSKWQQRITRLGVEELEVGYATVAVHGEGKVAILASVVDATTGDATSVDAVHPKQVIFGDPTKADQEEENSHFLVAVVARLPGAEETVWRSEVSILNPIDEKQELEIRYLPSNGEMQSAAVELESEEVFSSLDVLGDVFPEAGDGAGAFHIYGDSGLIVNSRTYNLLPDDATVGQSIPGLAEGDMARPGEVWVVDSLKQTDDFRCNMGFAEFEGSDAEITVVLFDINAATLRYLASKTYSVPAFSQFQVNRIFSDMDLRADYPNALAYVSVATDAGALYVYASVIDNRGGDGTTILGKRQ